ncbi:heterokaryon incompatibility protein-domain-containing protein [Triangularia verruculosa]|uniref:Heterokaryon incompatibility protein-domain-containing protein n=1 Tax=Triangularia verruculosa TaxID=2587418 RepID=A0AAN6XJD9_9PEZI|nr:heterokaryon incompatibility protein-domain-containing protein [Triangularia verruculosa]
MPARCQPCTKLSIPHLFDLAKQHIRFREFPVSTYYKHHDSISNLEKSAANGCDLCELIIKAFKSCPAERGEKERETWYANGCKIEGSIFSAARNLEHSEIRMALDSSYAYAFTDDGLELTSGGTGVSDRSPILDILSVQVGAPRPMEYNSNTSDDERQDYEYELPVVPFRLVVPRDRPVVLENIRIGTFQVDSNLRSEENFDLSRSWLKECQQRHECCREIEAPTLPTRVLDVGTADTKFTTLRVMHSCEARGQYVALSHCWGGKIDTLLTAATMDTFMAALPFDILPANFRDAVTITRKLGIRYLWIDSLCIIQDSREDWEIESKRMAQVYGSATVTISALVSKASAEGILNTTPNLRPTPTPVPLQIMSERGDIITMKAEWRHPDEEENLKALDIWCPLNSRGWTFQEFLLSKRQLLYGKQQIYWRCPSGQKSAEAGCLPNGTKMADTIFPTISAALDEAARASADAPDVKSLLHEYYSAVETYSTRRLTFGSDKLPALSGIAQRLKAYVGGDYLAGLWSNDLRIGLLWRTEVNNCPHYVPYRSPSWSWAITDGIVRWPEPRTDYGVGPLDMRVIETKVVPQSFRNPFGEVQDGHLVLRGYTKKLICSNQVLYEDQFEQADDDPTVGEGFFDELYDDKARKDKIYSMTRLVPTHTPNSMNRDTIVSVRTRRWPGGGFPGHPLPEEFDRAEYGRRDYLAFLVRISAAENPFQEDCSIVYDSDARALCLAVRRVEGRAEDVYERVGMLEIRKWDIEWIQDWELRTVALI